jgi:hypothetical protein
MTAYIGKCIHCGQQTFWDKVAGTYTMAAEVPQFKCQGRVIKSLGHAVKGF